MSSGAGQFQDLSYAYYANGELRRSKGETYWEVLDPATEEPLGQVADCTPEEIAEVVRIANRAQREWKKTSALERAEMLHQVARDIRADQQEIAELQTQEMGKTYKESHDELDWCISAIDYYAEAARHEYGTVLGPTVRGNLQYTIKEPIGVLLSIATYNYPNLLSTWEAASAIATGSTAIIKPSQITSLVTLRYLQAWSALPPGVIQCVTGRGIAGKLVASPDIHGVAFTGGIEVGQKVARVCGEMFKPCLVEASGNDPFIVMPSAPMEMAVQGAAFAAFVNCGQVCTSAERLYVHEDIHDEFAERLADLARSLRVGNGLAAVDMGPMASADDRDHYEAALKSALAEGARLLCGGGRPAGLDKGWFVEPTVLVDVGPDFEILKDEIFGPVAPIVKIGSLDEALEYSNRSHFGLGANIYTMDLAEAFRAIDEFVAGMVWVNAPLLDNDAGPFGGRKMSGIGRELGADGLDIWRHTKLVLIDPAASAHDFWWFPYKDEEAHPKARK